MRTTIDIDDDLLRTTKALSEVRGITLSRVVCELAWKGLSPERNTPVTRNGFPVLPVRAGSLPVTSEHVADLMEAADRAEAAVGEAD